jgi:FKBP-type peptidyl-prolyl cis-trans isomerase FkpA
MKKLFYILIVVGLISFIGCGKSYPDNPPCTANPVSSDSAALLKFAADSMFKVTRDSSGLYYQIIDSGSSHKPTYSSMIEVSYVGRLMSGYSFDSADSTTLEGHPISELILGWRVAMPKIGEGGHIKMLIPSALAWGCTGYGPVPANAPVYFDVQLIKVN